MFFFLGMAGAKVFARVTLIPRTFLWPIVLVFSVVGSYALNQSTFDVYVMLVSGVLGFLMLRHGFGPAPFVMGLILGKLIEENWENGMVFYDHNMLRFLESPIVVGFLLASLLTVFWIPLTNAIQKIRATKVDTLSDE